VQFFSATFLQLLELLRNSFIATAKTSYTPGTISDIKSELGRDGGIRAAASTKIGFCEIQTLV
jgi:hypothetical protein